MGVCASCLQCPSWRDWDEQSDTCRGLLEDDIYNNNYGTTGRSQQRAAEAEHLREAYENICQRMSDSLVDIWSRNSQLIPYVPNPTMHAELQRPEQVMRPDLETSFYDNSNADNSSLSLLNPAGGELGRTKFLPLSSSSACPTDPSPAAPKQWSEIVIPKSLTHSKYDRSRTLSQIDAVLKDENLPSDSQFSPPVGIFDVLPVA